MKKPAKSKHKARKSAAKKTSGKKGKTRIQLELSTMEVDRLGRVIINDPKLRKQVAGAKSSQQKLLAADINKMCTCVAGCGGDSLCTCA